jgi:hypothetical protein
MKQDKLTLALHRLDTVMQREPSVMIGQSLYERDVADAPAIAAVC